MATMAQILNNPKGILVRYQNCNSIQFAFLVNLCYSFTIILGKNQQEGGHSHADIFTETDCCTLCSPFTARSMRTGRADAGLHIHIPITDARSSVLLCGTGRLSFSSPLPRQAVSISFGLPIVRRTE